ncbi:MAG: hypothetical protein QXO76_02735 [Thermoproteota archaeon]
MVSNILQIFLLTVVLLINIRYDMYEVVDMHVSWQKPRSWGLGLPCRELSVFGQSQAEYYPKKEDSMKLTAYLTIVLLLSFALTIGSAFAENQPPTVFPVPGANVRVLLDPQTPIKECITDENGEFSVTWDEISAKVIKGRDVLPLSHQVRLLFKITPPQGFQFLAESSMVSLNIARFENRKSTMKFVLYFRKLDSKTNKGAFVINPKMDSG